MTPDELEELREGGCDREDVEKLIAEVDRLNGILDAQQHRRELRERAERAEAEVDRLNIARGHDAETISRLAEEWNGRGYAMYESCARDLLDAFGVAE